MQIFGKTRFTLKRARGKRRPTVDGIATHCGFMEPSVFDPRHISDRDINRACDQFMCARGMQWCGALQDYLTPADADAVVAAVRRSLFPTA